jgi:hypothetical protein
MVTHRAEFKIRESPGVVATAGRTNIKLDDASVGAVRTLSLSAGPNIQILSSGDTNELKLSLSADYTTQFQVNSGNVLKKNNLHLIAGSNMHIISGVDDDTLTVELSSRGDQGDQGYQGNQGYQGEIGYTGDQGPQGISGYQGFQGISGTGPQGIQGEQGYQGERGYQGPSGGAQGDQGYQGGLGSTGTTGAAGADSPGPSVVKSITATNNFKPGDVIRHDGINYIKSVGSDSVSATVIGVISSASTSAFNVVTHGYIDSLSGLEPGTVYYLSNTSQGEAISVVPTTLGHYIKPVMYADTASSAFVNIQSSEKIGVDISSNSNVHTVTLTSHGFTVGTPIYFDGITYRASNCTAGSTAEVLGIVQTTTTDSFTYVSDGSITFDTNYFSMAPGSIYFLGTSLSGQLVTAEPVHGGYISKPILYSISDSQGLVKNYRGITVAGTTGPVPAMQSGEDPVARNNVLLLWMEHSIRDSLINGEAQDGDHDVFISNTIHGLIPRIEKFYQEHKINGSQSTLNDSFSTVYPTFAAGRSIDAVYDSTYDLYHNRKETVYRHVFEYYGSDKTWTVPNGLDSTVTTVSAHLWGAGGGGGGANNVASLLATGGPGGYTYGHLAVSAGETLTMVIGRHGNASTNTSGGPNLSGQFQSPGLEYGGGARASTVNACGDGGGRTAIRRDSTELITAGGGGGAGTGDDGRGGAGNGGTGFDSGSAVGGGAGTLTQGGSAWDGSYDATPLNGSQFTGGVHSTDTYGGAGGGGGYYGGAAGGVNYGVDNNAAGAGGGSGYTGSATSTSMLSSSTTAPPNNIIEQHVYDAGAGYGGARGAAGGAGMAVIEYTTLLYTNMIITSEPVSAVEIPTKSRVVLLYKPEVDITLNTDVKLFVSRNDGAIWDEATLTYEGMYDNEYQILAGTGSVSNQSLSAVTDFEGASNIPVMRWKIQTYNNKYQKIKGVAQMWS